MDKCQKTNNKILRLCMVIRFSRKTVTVAGAFAICHAAKRQKCSSTQAHPFIHPFIPFIPKSANQHENHKCLRPSQPLLDEFMTVLAEWLYNFKSLIKLKLLMNRTEKQ